MIFIGIDPGKGGGLAAICGGQCISIIPMPLAGSDVDFGEVVKWIRAMKDIAIEGWRMPQEGEESFSLNVIAYIEKVGAFPNQGVVSMFKFGFVTGGIHGVLAAMMIPRYQVTPVAWKRKVLTGTSKDKQAAIEHIARAFPKVSLLATERSRKRHSGMADALCIAEYGYRTYKDDS